MRSYIPCSVPKFQQTRCVYRHYMLYPVEKSYSCEIMSGICAMKVILYLRSVYTQLNGTGSDRFSGHWKHSRSIFFQDIISLEVLQVTSKFPQGVSCPHRRWNASSSFHCGTLCHVLNFSVMWGYDTISACDFAFELLERWTKHTPSIIPQVLPLIIETKHHNIHFWLGAAYHCIT